MKGSLEEYENVAGLHREKLLQTEVAWLKATRTDIVVSDVVPMACTAAARAGIPCVCVSNFSWDFIYSEYLLSTSGHEKMVWQIAEDYHKATCLLRLPGHSPMPAFRKVVDVPLVVRRARRTAAEVRAELGLRPGSRMVVFMFGGQSGSTHWRLEGSNLPDGWTCVVCRSAFRDAVRLPDNFLLAPADAYVPDLVNAADCVMGKIGYGAVSECLAHGKPLIFVRRDYFNEEPFLRKLLEIHGAAVEMNRRTFLAGHWGAYLDRALALEPRYPEPTNGAEVVAGLLESIARQEEEWKGKTQQDSHLMDTVVWGYLMRAAASRQSVDVPEWYTRGSWPTGEGAPPADEGRRVRWQSHFECRHGIESIAACDDTGCFLELLSDIAEGKGCDSNELRAAQSLFLRGAEIVVARAPGRLDVMGGIADYSGSHVLQMPTAAACHVAAQLQPVGRQRLWRHMEAAGGGRRAALRVVSLNADHVNRAPTFDMFLADLKAPDGSPLPYKEARERFRQVPAQAWAAYVVGCLLVLMAEKGVEPERAGGLSVLVQSEVPDGKGVSSSAALEVSTMMALCRLYGVEVEGRELAILCQTAENKVVGAPCGVMDQMTAALGKEGHLLSMVCQPAEVKGFLKLPPHVKIWGLDSGIRHAVVGADYSSVRTGAFMGLKIASAHEQRLQQERARSNPELKQSETDKDAELIGGGYFANITPSVFSSRYLSAIPSELKGSDFLAEYGKHCDSVTEVDPQERYAVRLPSLHPVHENFRVRSFQQVMAAPNGQSQMEILGELMFQSHESYSSLGLGSEGTDSLCRLVLDHARREDPQLFGAKITGGGSGGTVCVLGNCTPGADEAIENVRRAYKELTGYYPMCFSGSSRGAVEYGHVVIVHRF